MLARMPSRLFSEWMAYAQLEPFGEGRADLRAGIVASVIANRWRGEDEREYKPEDFVAMPELPKEAEPVQSWQHQLLLVEMLNAAFGGKDERKGIAES